MVSAISECLSRRVGRGSECGVVASITYYYDCIENRKARLHLVTFEAGLGGLLRYGARRLRRNGRLAKESGNDPTDYTASAKARSFVPFYAQRLSSACVMHGASAIQKSLKSIAARRRSAVTAA